MFVTSAPGVAAPFEEIFGRADGYPRGHGNAAYLDQYRVGSFSAMDQIFPHCTIAPSDSPLPLEPAAEVPGFQYGRPGQQGSIDDYLNREPATGLLILKDGKVLVERYQYDRNERHRFLANSMTKTIVALAVGVALAENKIDSLDDKAVRYEPRLAGTSYGETSIRHLLRMSSGVPFREDYDGNDDIAGWTIAEDISGVLSAARTYSAPAHEPGERFHYASSETAILGLVLRGATGRSLCDWVGEKIWRPIGAQNMASWTLAFDGVEKAHSGFNATLRDYARLGWMLANDGAINGRQLIPREFLLDATRAERQPPNFRPGVMEHKAGQYFGYGYQTWIFPGSQPRFALIGVYGQVIFVDPTLKLVMVHTSVGRGPLDVREAIALWYGVVGHYGPW